MKFKILAYVPDKDIFTQRDEIFKLIMEFETFEQALNYVRSWQSYFINWGITNIETNVFMAVKYRPIPIPKCNKLFDGKANARFCSPRCRKRAQRAKVSSKGTPNQTIYDHVRKQLYELAGLNSQNTIKALILIGLELLDENQKRKIYEMLREYPWENQ